MERELKYEVRLCNYLYLNDEPTKIDVLDIDIWDQDYPINGCEPIALDDEWANKFEFESLVEMASYFCSESRYPIVITAEDLKVMKVHEAQNLFQALTGEELTLQND